MPLRNCLSLVERNVWVCKCKESINLPREAAKFEKSLNKCTKTNVRAENFLDYTCF